MQGKQSYTLVIIPNSDKPVSRFTVPLLIVYSVIAFIIIIFVIIFGIMYRMHAHANNQTTQFKQDISKQYEQFQSSISTKDHQIVQLQNQVIQLAEQAKTVQSKLEEITKIEQQVNKLTQINHASGHDVQIQSVDPNNTIPSNVPLLGHTDIQQLSIQTEISFQQLQQQMNTLKANLSSSEKLLQEKQHLLQITPSIWPTISHLITSGFGYRSDPFTHQPSFHDGIDIGGKENDPVYATAEGTVLTAGTSKTRGNFIVIDHSQGILTYYLHLHKILVHSSEQVTKGEIIGKIGTTGRSTGPHLHYGIKKNGHIINPLLYLKH